MAAELQPLCGHLARKGADFPPPVVWSGQKGFNPRKSGGAGK